MTEFFGELYLRSTTPFLTPQGTTREVEYLWNAFERNPGTIVDLGCGHGRHAGPLGSRRPVIGLELDALSIQRREPGFEAVRADLFALPLRAGSVANAYAWYSTLFVFDDERIASLLKAIAGVMKPGGLLVFHTVPYERVAAEPIAGWEGDLPDGSHLLEKSRFDPAQGRDLGHRRLTLPDGRVLEAEFFIRYFPLAEHAARLSAAGFTLAWAHGGLSGEPLTSSSTDLIVGANRNA